jgi:hypothetical protein
MSRFLCWGSAPPTPPLPPPQYSKNIGGGPIKWLHVEKDKPTPFPPPPLEWGYFFMLQKKGIIWMIDEIYCNFHTNMDDG